MKNVLTFNYYMLINPITQSEFVAHAKLVSIHRDMVSPCGKKKFTFLLMHLCEAKPSIISLNTGYKNDMLLNRQLHNFDVSSFRPLLSHKRSYSRLALARVRWVKFVLSLIIIRRHDLTNNGFILCPRLLYKLAIW